MSAPASTSGSPGIEFYGGYQVYSESGVDLTLLRENLKRSIEERLDHNSRFLALIGALRDSSQNGYAPRNNMLDPAPLLRQLHDHQVDYVLIGGLAMIAHGSAYITKDLDICYSRTPRNLASVAAAFAPIHPYLRGVPPGLPFRFDVPTIQAGLNFTLVTDWGDVDLLGEVAGVGAYDKARAQSVEMPMHGLTIHVLTLDGLIASKKAAGRPKDRNHLLELEELKKMLEGRV